MSRILIRALQLDSDEDPPIDRHILCECLDTITLDDLDRGYHGCGRTVQVVVGKPGSAYGVEV